MVDDYEYEAGTLNEQWDQFEIKEDKGNGRLVIQRSDAAPKTELFTLGTGGTLSIDKLNGVKYISSASDLPDASGGERQLDDNTAYYFTDFVSDDASLRLGTNSPIIGAHGGVNGYIHTGAGDCLVGTNKGFFARNMYFHAPGGTMFNLVGDTTTEMLVEMCSFSDAAGIANIADLGTIDGFRVPSFKGCNFEEFDQGITFTGTCEKIFFSESPFREISASGVTIFDFDANFNTDIVDIVDCYIKGVQNDTVVVDVDAGAAIGEIFQYRGVTHDPSVTEDNILTGQAGFDNVGYNVQDSYPIQDSGTFGELSLDSPTTMQTAAAGADTYTIMDDGTTTLGSESERISKQSDGVLQVDSTRTTTVYVTINATVDTGGDTVAVTISKNGTPQTTSEMQVTGSASTQSFISAGGVENCTAGDTIEAQIKNVDAAADVTVNSFTLNVVGV